ncbi:MAG: lysophospholipid acyltransferase family protein [Flavobacteriales bacterium]|nr:lysophospholipid acyltransferase family protein [Flavobacteriales bacterium]
MSSQNGTWKGTSRGTPLGYRFFILILRTLGPRVAHAFLWFVVPWYAITARASNEAIRGYFQRLRATGHRDRLTVIGSYMTFGRSLIDRAAMRAGRASDYTWLKLGTVQPLRDAGAGVVISAHVGNWELAGNLLGHQSDMPVHVLMQDAEVAAIARAQEEGQERRAFNVIAIKDDFSHVYAAAAAMRAGGLLCLHGDRFLPGARTVARSFLGFDALFPVGPFALARSLQVPVSYAFVVNTAPLCYAFHATAPLPAGSSVDTLIDAYVQALEEVVNKYPLQWFNYYDFWRHDTGTGQRR